MNPSEFIAKHSSGWKKLEEFEKRIQKSGWSFLSKSDIWSLALLYRTVSSHLAVARAKLPGALVTTYLNQLVSRIYNRFYRPRRQTGLALRIFYSDTFPNVMRRNWFRVSLAAAIMGVSALLGFLVTLDQPQVAGIFLSDASIQAVKEGKLWTEGLFNIFPSSVLAVSVFCNNISVSFAAFSLGLLFGVGTVYILFLNGLMLGTMLAFTLHHGKFLALIDFVAAHGPLELTLICVAAAAGFNLARAELFPGSRTRSLAFKEEGYDGTKMVLGSVPFFILAGLVEGFISPDPRISLPIKAGIGLLLLGAYLGYAFGYRKRKQRDKPKPIAELAASIEHPATTLARMAKANRFS